MALDETVKRLRAARDVSAALESPRLAVTLSDLDEVLDAADLLCRLRELPSAKPERAERADVATLERVRERLRGLYNETSPHNATASRMLFVIDDMLAEARAQPAAVSEPSFYPFGTAVRVPRVDLGNVSLEAAAEGEWTGGDPIAAAIVARAKQAEAQAHETADLLVAMQRRAEKAEADLACERAITDQLVVSQLDRERASHERLIDVIAQETNAAGISDTMTPEERVRAVCGALARERDAHIRFSEERRAEVERLKAAIANAMQALGLVAPSPIESISAIGRELDDARAEVERLKADLTRAVTAPCDACGHGKGADWKALEAEVERLKAELDAADKKWRGYERDVHTMQAEVEAEPVAEGRACPWDDRRDNIRAAIRMVHQANEPHSSAIHGVTIALEQLALAVDEVRRLGGGGR